MFFFLCINVLRKELVKLKLIAISPNDFQRVIHGNRSIQVPSDIYHINEIIQVYCSDYHLYSYALQTKITNIYAPTKIKTTTGYRSMYTN